MIVMIHSSTARKVSTEDFTLAFWNLHGADNCIGLGAVALDRERIIDIERKHC
jgi:hypothetical protein